MQEVWVWEHGVEADDLIHLIWCQVTEASPGRYGGRCNGTDNPPTVIVSPGDHLKEYMMEDDDYERRSQSPPAVLFDE